MRLNIALLAISNLIANYFTAPTVLAEKLAAQCYMPDGSYEQTCNEIKITACYDCHTAEPLYCDITTQCQPNNPALKKHSNHAKYAFNEQLTGVRNVDGELKFSDRSAPKMLLAFETRYVNCKVVDKPGKNLPPQEENWIVKYARTGMPFMGLLMMA